MLTVQTFCFTVPPEKLKVNSKESPATIVSAKAFVTAI